MATDAHTLTAGCELSDQSCLEVLAECLKGFRVASEHQLKRQKLHFSFCSKFTEQLESTSGLRAACCGLAQINKDVMGTRRQLFLERHTSMPTAPETESAQCLLLPNTKNTGPKTPRGPRALPRLSQQRPLLAAELQSRQHGVRPVQGN